MGSTRNPGFSTRASTPPLDASNLALLPCATWREMILCAPLDAERVRARCRAWRCGVVVQRAVGLAWDAFVLDATPEILRWAHSQESSEFEQRALGAYVSADRSYASQAVAGLQAVRKSRVRRCGMQPRSWSRTAGMCVFARAAIAAASVGRFNSFVTRVAGNCPARPRRG